MPSFLLSHSPWTSMTTLQGLHFIFSQCLCPLKSGTLCGAPGTMLLFTAMLSLLGAIPGAQYGCPIIVC